MKHFNLAVFPADGIGPEVIAASQQVLRKLEQLHGGVRFACREFDWSSAYYHKTGAMMPADGLQQLEAGGFDALLMGPVGSPAIPDHITLWGLLLTIRQGFDQYVNLRPMRLLTGVATPLRNPGQHPINMVCIRENSEGEYAGVGGRLHQGKAWEVAIQSIVFTRSATERVMRFAFDYAQQHGHRLVTNVTKSNSMQHNMVFWDEVFQQVAAQYPTVATDQQLVDSMTARMVSQPETVDVFVASNLFGDILSDLGAALTGSMGLAPSANLNPERQYPSLFQAIHGSAFSLVGKNVANPIASIWSVQMMLAFLGETQLAAQLMHAIETVLREQCVRTRDLGGTSSTTEMTKAVCQALETAAR
ncbi:tartrate dehydrogenase [Hymenobacter elongatus]|uniref:D-malate dehydrogenase (decarboxylating) n=1 Tax=Hymenobacter elongatus TaxID=877208 RepID=A0A4Z0PQI7_9BACT|nr:tartrate dehydrogenase [Hymenobacter elongatus]TGE18312.1 tartrate dehydrogenase [Hymenobacter elongatus]